MPAFPVLQRAAYVIASLAPAWAVITVVSDGVTGRIGPVRISSTEPVRPMLVGIAAAAWYVWRSSRTEVNADALWLRAALEHVVKLTAPLLILLGCLIGLKYGTFSAAGSDAYGYVSQAALWLDRNLRIEQPIVREVSWPDAAWTFTPLGYRPGSDVGDIVPTYPAGLPIMMAAFQAAFGADGVFFVVPVLASFALAFTYILGHATTGSTSVGGLAALLLLTSPTFLAHIMVPMSDVPVTAGWTLVCLLAVREPAPRPLVSGLAAGASLLIRPNLLLLAFAPVLAWVFARRPKGRPYLPAWRPTLWKIAFFGAGLLPGVIAIAAINAAMYGSPFASGYGRLGENYDVRAAPQNLRNYGAWLLETQTALVALALIPFLIRRALRCSTDRSSSRACLVALPALALVSYIFYASFGNWTYLRFLLPAYPAIFVLMAAGVRVICKGLPAPIRVAAAMSLVALCVSLSLQFARKEFVFDWREHEQRYVRAGERVVELTPADAVLFSSQHSGSLRYYTNRLTLRYDLLDKGHLDSAIAQLREMGRPSFLVIDDWERAEFRNRFAGQRRSAAIEGTPFARVHGRPEVLIYNLGDSAE